MGDRKFNNTIIDLRSIAGWEREDGHDNRADVLEAAADELERLEKLEAAANELRGAVSIVGPRDCPEIIWRHANLLADVTPQPEESSDE